MTFLNLIIVAGVAMATMMSVAWLLSVRMRDASDYTNVYQAVYADGFYYNISRELPPAGGEQTGYLRGTFSDVGDRYRIEFTRSIAVGGWLSPGTGLADAGLAVESGAVTGRDVPGPIGVRGYLQNIYVDDELRIVTGKSDGDAADSLFVLERTEAVVQGL